MEVERLAHGTSCADTHHQSLSLRVQRLVVRLYLKRSRVYSNENTRRTATLLGFKSVTRKGDGNDILVLKHQVKELESERSRNTTYIGKSETARSPLNMLALALSSEVAAQEVHKSWTRSSDSNQMTRYDGICFLFSLTAPSLLDQVNKQLDQF